MKFIATFLFIIISGVLIGQCSQSVEATNGFRRMEVNSAHGFDDDHLYIPELDRWINISSRSSLWFKSFDPVGNLKLSACQSTNECEFTAGPLDVENGLNFSNNCDYFGRVWHVEGKDIKAIMDLLDELEPIQEEDVPKDLLEWPAIGNPYFDIGEENGSTLSQGLAPFYDRNADGIYNALDGDVPIIPNSNPIFYSDIVIPSFITFSVTNDMIIHSVTQVQPLSIELQEVKYMFSCENDDELNRTVFTNYKVLSRALEDNRFFRIGLFEDTDFYSVNDRVGCSAELNTFYNYINEELLPGQMTAFGGIIENYGLVRNNILLDSELSSFQVFYNGGFGNPHPATTDPQGAEEYLNFMDGLWRDGSELTFGGSGFNTGTDVEVNFLFPDLPNDPEGWSMVNDIENNNYDLRTLSIIRPEGFSDVVFLPGQISSFTVANYMMLDGENLGLSVFEGYDEKINHIKDRYSEMINEPSSFLVCQDFSSIVEDELSSAFTIYPNPVESEIVIELEERISGDVILLNSLGQIVRELKVDNSLNLKMDVQALNPGIYFLHLRAKNATIPAATTIIKI